MTPVFRDIKVCLAGDLSPVDAWPCVRRALQKAGIPQFRIDRIYKEAIKLSHDHGAFVGFLREYMTIEIT